MANVDAAFGFRPIRRLDGSAWSGNLTQKKGTSSTGALNRGDIVKVLATGYVDVSVAGTTTHVNYGVFMGCHYLSSTLGYNIWSNYWPGSGSTGDIDIFVIDDPLVVYEVQASAANIPLAGVGENGDFVVVSSTTGMSKWSLNSTTASTTTFPFKVLALGNNGVNTSNGYDSAGTFNIVEVCWNDHFLTQKASI